MERLVTRPFIVRGALSSDGGRTHACNVRTQIRASDRNGGRIGKKRVVGVLFYASVLHPLDEPLARESLQKARFESLRLALGNEHLVGGVVTEVA